MPIPHWPTNRRTFGLVLLLAFGMSVPSSLALQAPAAPAPQTAPKSGVPCPAPQVAPAPPAAKAIPLVISPQPTDKTQHPKTYCGTAKLAKPCRIGDTLVVSFDNLQQWMDGNKVNPASIYLVLNGREMKGLTSRGPSISYRSLEFTLAQIGDQPNDNRATWNTLITELRDGSSLHVSVSSGGAPPFPDPVDVPFEVFPSWTWAVVVLLLVMMVGFLMMAVQSDIVRDASSILGIKQSYSLARCQMAWWFFLVSTAYCYIWLTLNDHDSLTQGVLILTGISAATGLAGTVIAGSTGEDGKKQADDQAALQDRLAALPAVIAAETDPVAKADLQAELADKTASLKAIAKKGASDGLLFDLLRDDTGISFHRFQMVGWTVILGFVFIAAVYSQLTMPDFNATLLGLMGISSGTYIGFKASNLPKQSGS